MQAATLDFLGGQRVFGRRPQSLLEGNDLIQAGFPAQALAALKDRTQLTSITRAEFAGSALSGQGGWYASGRWHRAGQPVVYLASTWSLAALEVFVHLGRRDSAIPVVYFSVTIPPQVSTLTVGIDTLPSNWMSEPPSPNTQLLGTDWLSSQASVLLRVPSALSPAESEDNWILNPQHSDATKLISSEPRPFQFDRRWWKERP